MLGTIIPAWTAVQIRGWGVRSTAGTSSARSGRLRVGRAQQELRLGAIHLEELDPASAEVAPLIAALDAELVMRYPGEPRLSWCASARSE